MGGGNPSLDDNLIIHGDNLDALKALLPRYASRVNCIYIDPPYNTGNEKWVYNDNVNSPMMKEWLKGKSPVDGEDLERHDKLWPRLQLLRELLAEDGVIFISIDDNEQHRLRMVMDEIFGEENFVTQIAWQSRASVQNDTDISVNHEHILVYAKLRRREDRRLKKSNAHKWWGADGFAIRPLFVEKDKFSNPDSDPRGSWKADPFDAPNIRPNLTYEIKNPTTGEKFFPPEGRCWRVTQKKYLEFLKDNRIVFGKRGRTKPQLKVFFKEVQEFGQVETTWFDSSKVGTATEGTQEIETVFGRKYLFQHPKPVRMIKHLIRISAEAQGIILDSFAGSGTTAHAVLALNKEDGGNRKFILVECEDYADKITAERVRRVIKGVPKAKDENLKNGLGGSFAWCTLGDEISIEKMLTGRNLPNYETFARHLIYTATGQSPDKLNPKTKRGKDGLFYETSDRMFYLIYEPNLDFLRSTGSALNSTRAERIAKQAKAKEKTAVVFATHKFMGQKELTEMGITFAQLPYGKWTTN